MVYTPDMNHDKEEQEQDDDYMSKVPAKYKDLYDADDFEKFTYRKSWED
jgi:hypothetical protein